MSLLAAAALSSGVSAVGNMANSAMNYGFNKALQEDTQKFNAEESQKSRDFTAQENALNRDFNSAEAQKSREFQEHMAETNYQRTVSDMEKAGLNPAALGGVGATGTGSAGASASYSSAGSAAAASSNVGRVGLGEFFNNALINAFTNKDVVESFANNLKSNAKEVKAIDDLKPYDLMSAQQKELFSASMDKEISAHRRGVKPRFTADEKDVRAYYDQLVKALGKL